MLEGMLRCEGILIALFCSCANAMEDMGGNSGLEFVCVISVTGEVVKGL
jgi:hypothetical protein